MLEEVPPGQHPMMRTTTAWMGMISKATERMNPVRGMIPNWQRKPMQMPHGRFMCPRNFLSSTLHPMENITRANRTVRTTLRTALRTALKLLSGTRQDVPLQTVALAKQTIELSIAGCSAQTLTGVHSSSSPLLLLDNTVCSNRIQLLNPFQTCVTWCLLPKPPQRGNKKQ